MADFILPVLLIVGCVCWTIIRVYAEMMRPVPRGGAFGFEVPAAALVGVAWLAHSIYELIG